MMEINGVETPNICQEHWDKLREEVERLGMSEWVANSGRMVAEMMVDQVKEGLNVGNWDPLMNAWFALQINAMEAMGAQYMMAAGRCIICVMNGARNPDGSCACPNPDCGGKAPGSIEDFETWLTRAAEGQLEFGRAQGLIK